MSRKRLPSAEEAYEAQPWMHIYAQTENHQPAYIEGNRVALEALRDAIIAALKKGEADTAGSIFAGDGEGYHVTVKLLAGPDQLGPLPYTDCDMFPENCSHRAVQS